MPNIFIDVFLRNHKQSLDDSEREIQRRYSKSGEDASKNFMDAVERGINSRSSKVRAAAERVLSANESVAASQRNLAKADDARVASIARIEQAEKARIDRMAASQAAINKLADVEQRMLRARTEAVEVNRRIVNAESELGSMRRQHAASADAILQTEKALRATRAAEGGDVDRSRRLYALLQRQREAYRAESNAMRHATLDLAQAKDAEARATAGVNFLQRTMNSIRQDATRQARDAAAAEREYSRATQDSAKAAEAAMREATRLEQARRRQHSARRGFMEAEEDRPRRGGGGGGGGFGSFERGLGGIFTSIPFVPGGKAGAVIGTGLITALGGIAEAVTTASQALWLLPAATAAAGAGFATLKIGMSGFDKALKDMGNAKKFAEDLQGLAPNAQQAALEIQHLVGGLDGLKNLVQQSLFNGVAQDLHKLGNAFMPSLRQMFSGIAGAFNGMFGNAIGQLTSSGGVSSIKAIIDNIVHAFQNLTPAMAPVVDAFTRIAKVGSDFLPGMGTAITDLAQRFDDFIARAQQTGQLQHWIQQGIDAAKELGHWLGDLAHKFYDVFGNKNPQQFSQTLSTITGTLTTIGHGMIILSNTVNDLVRDINPVAKMLGGWPNLIKDVIAVWALWKVGGLISDLMKVGTLLGVSLPAAAESGAGRISAALAAIKMPAWIATFLALWNLHGDAPGSTKDTANDKQIAGNKYFDKNHRMPDGYQQWLDGKGPMPKDLAPFYKPGAKPGDGDVSNWPTGAWGNKPWSDPGNQFWKDPWSPYAVPGVPDKKGKHGVGADRDYTPYGPDYAAPPRPGESEEEYGAEGSVMDAKHRLEQDRQTLLKMQQDNNVTAEERQEQENKIAHDQRELNQEQLRLAEVQKNAVKKNLKGLKDANDEFNNIDQDFGLSQGLPGLVKNLVGMLGDLAAAPLMGQLKAITQATGTDKNTFGAFGIMGQRNIAAGKSPIFGIPAGQPGGPAMASDNAAWGTVGAGPWDQGYTTTPGYYGQNAYLTPSYTGTGQPGITGANLASAIRPAGGPGAQGNSNLNWDALAAKESSGNWSINTGNGYYGGLQFDQNTWNAYKPPGAPSNPAQATREQQIAAGQAGIAARGGPQSLWPQNYGQLYSVPSDGAHNQNRWSPYYDGAAGFGGWVSSGGSGGGGFAPAGYSAGGGGGGFPGLGANMPGGAGVTYTQALMKQLGLQPLAMNPAGGGNPTLPQWLQDFVHTYGGPSLTAGSSPHGSLHGVAGGSDYATDVTGAPADMDRLAKYLYDNPSLSAQMIHQGQDGFDYGVAGGQRVPYGSYYTTPGGTYGDEGPMVHWAPAIGGGPQAQLSSWTGGFPQAPVPMPGGDGSPGGMGDSAPGGLGSASTGGGGMGMFSHGVPGSQGPLPGAPGAQAPGIHAQLASFGQPDPGAPGGYDEPPKPIGLPPNQGWQPQGGGAAGIGGLPLAALTTAAGMFPGGGAAAQTAMQLINRTIGYGQQAAAIGMQGLLDTFKIDSPDGEDGGKSDLSQGWYSRVLAGFAGARPATPGGAGEIPKAKKGSSDPTKDPTGKEALGQDSGGDTHNVYGGMNIPGSNNTININPQQGPSMSQASSDLSTSATAPPATSVMGF